MDDKQPGIRKYYDPRGKELDLLKRVYDRYYTIKDSSQRQELVTIWDSAIKNWDAKRPEKSEDLWQSNYFVPITTAHVESILSEMVDQTPRPIILPRSSEDQPKALVMQHIFDYTWQVADGDMELFNWMKNTLLFGTGFVQEYFYQDRRIVQMLKKFNKKNKPEYEEKEVFEYDDCYMENVTPYDLFWDENAREVNRGTYKARDVVRRYIMNINAFRDFFAGDVWDQLGNAKYVKPGGDTNYYEYFKPPTADFPKDNVEVLWYWARRPDDLLVVVANDVVVKMGPNPYRHKQLPFAKSVDISRPHQFYGKGEPELLESMQEELNIYRRLWGDRSKLDLQKMFLVSNRETLDDRDLIARPHGVIPVDDPKSVVPVEYNDIARSVQILQDEISKDAIKVTGVEDRFQSVNTPSTATEAAILKESVIRRIRMKLRFFEKGSLVDVGRMRVANIIQFYSQPKLEKIVGETTSATYRARVSQANRTGKLVVKDGQAYEKKYHSIRIEGKRLVPNERGELQEESILGLSFFEATPETFLPAAQGGFDIQFEAGSTMPVSKPLMQSKSTEMFDRLMQVAPLVGYDPQKIADSYVEAHDKNPMDFKKSDTGANVEAEQKNMVVQLAQIENEQIVKNVLDQVNPNGTPFANPAHNELHIALLRSNRIPVNSEQFRFLLKHIMGEQMAIMSRQETAGAEGATEGMKPPAAEGSEMGTAPNFNKEMKDMQPNMIQGGGEVPQQPPSRGLLSGVRNFFRGGA